jgi:2',3'-cyclic-nucleotide 2'-phosphodiesterase (5'-nucleotidase family)
MKRFFLLLTLLASAVWGDDVRTLTILHTNDLHARLKPLENGRGGFARLATLIRKEKAGCTDCILLNGGDLVQGSPVSTIFKGAPVYEIGNMLGFDVACLGNHEFDYGWEQARKFIKMAKYPIVNANLMDGHGRLFTPKPFVILKVNGLRVAVIGAMTSDLSSLTTPKTRGPVQTTPVLETVKRYLPKLRQQSDLVVVLGHISTTEEKDLIMAGPEIPVIVTGHDHRGLQAPLIEGGRILVRTRAYAEEIGKLKLKVDVAKKSVVSWTWERVPVTDSLEPAKDVATVVDQWEAKVTEIVDRPLVTSHKDFTRAEVKALIEAAMRDETGADFAFMNSGGVRDIIPKGQLRERNVWNIMPFDNMIVTGKFKGKELPAVITDGKTIDPEKEYTFAVSDFTAANQSARGELQSTGLKFTADGPLLRDAIIRYIRKRGELN